MPAIRFAARANPMFAIVSDIHGNLEAFTAVLAEIDRRGVQQSSASATSSATAQTRWNAWTW